MAQEAHAFIKALLDVPVLYGGSVKPENAAELLAQPDVDGALVGGASLELDSFAAICRAASPLVALVILDGWGCAPPGPGNAVELADDAGLRPALARRTRTRRSTASGEAVGLPPGQMGNSEVGHLTIGSGRVLFQDLMRVNQAIADGSLLREPGARARRSSGARATATSTCSASSRTAASTRTSTTCARCSSSRGARGWRSGRGSTRSPTAATSRRRRPSHDLAELPADRIATVVGRYYAMDRDRRWERTQRALDAITPAIGEPRRRPGRRRAASYDARRHRRVHRADRRSTARPRLEPGDTAIFFNFRPDRGAAALAAAARGAAST